MALEIPEHLTHETKLYLTGSLDSFASLKDNWYSVPDPALKGVSVPCACGETVNVVADLSANIHTDPYNEDEVSCTLLISKQMFLRKRNLCVPQGIMVIRDFNKTVEINFVKYFKHSNMSSIKQQK